MKRHFFIRFMIFLLACFILTGCSGSGYEVTFFYGYGGQKETITMQEGLLSKPTDPERYGYSFMGWEYTDSNGVSQKWNFDSDRVTEKTLLKAIWEPWRITLFLDLNGGTGCPDSIAVSYGESMEMPKPDKPGYTFMGWTYSDRPDANFAFTQLNYQEDVNITAAWLPFNPDILMSFGAFEQNNQRDCPEPIEWIILDYCDGTYTLLSKKVLYAMTYESIDHFQTSAPAYGNSEIRSWLNTTFYAEAFSDFEKQYMNDIIIGDLGITDKVTLLSLSERQKYLAKWRLQQCLAVATEYAVSAGLLMENKYGSTEYSWWWLRQEKKDMSSMYQLYPASAFKSTSAGNSARKMYGIRPMISVDEKAFQNRTENESRNEPITVRDVAGV